MSKNVKTIEEFLNTPENFTTGDRILCEDPRDVEDFNSLPGEFFLERLKGNIYEIRETYKISKLKTTSSCDYSSEEEEDYEEDEYGEDEEDEYGEDEVKISSQNNNSNLDKSTQSFSDINNYKVKYEPEVLYEFANRLYNQATIIPLIYTITGGLIGGLIGRFLLPILLVKQEYGLIAIIFVFGMAIIGYLIGYETTFWIKLHAQIALCQLQIEKNTRKDNVKEELE